VILGSDVSRAYKPTKRAYQHPAQLLGLDAGEVMLVAAHNQDLLAARDAGLATAFVARPHEYGPGQSTDIAPGGNWDLSVSSVIELADNLCASHELDMTTRLSPIGDA
jgi:2-haloacid dehalogenase